jgi:hypothetical protein
MIGGKCSQRCEGICDADTDDPLGGNQFPLQNLSAAFVDNETFDFFIEDIRNKRVPVVNIAGDGQETIVLTDCSGIRADSGEYMIWTAG